MPPEKHGHGSALPETLEKAKALPKEVLVTSNGQQFGLYTTRAIRTKRYKYVWNLTDTDEFYDLEADPGEKNNLIARPDAQETIHTLRRKLYEMLMETGDRFAGSQWMKRQLLEDRKLVR